MKPEVRFLGLDDGPFSKGDASAPVFGVVTRGASYIEGVLADRVEVDGDDATDVLLRMVRRSRFRPLLRAIFLNGVFLGGFNLVDVDRLREATELPIVAVVRTAPRPRKVRRAVQAAFDDWEPRWERIRELAPARLVGTPVWATVRGTSRPEAARLHQAATIRGNLPEPLRLAHVIASGVVRGESRGPA